MGQTKLFECFQRSADNDDPTFRVGDSGSDQFLLVDLGALGRRVGRRVDRIVMDAQKHSSFCLWTHFPLNRHAGIQRLLATVVEDAASRWKRNALSGEASHAAPGT